MSLLRNLEDEGYEEIMGQLLNQTVEDSYPPGSRVLYRIAGECVTKSTVEFGNVALLVLEHFGRVVCCMCTYE